MDYTSTGWHGGNHRPDWRITIAGLDPLEITNAHSKEHARTVALDYLKRTGRQSYRPSDVLRIEKLPMNLARHKARIAEAEMQAPLRSERGIATRASILPD
jgi:hypothetical protein